MNSKQLLMMASLVTVLMMFKGSTMTTRGIRNNNAGNIRGASYTWQGEVGRDKDNFVIFNRPENGIRAMARIIKTYRTKYGLVSLNGIISRWAPPNENNTEAYIAHAEKALKVDRFVALGDEHLPDLVKVIIKHENGVQPYSDEVIHAGIKAA